MKLYLSATRLVLLLLLSWLPSAGQAQAPTSVTGLTFFTVATDGAPPFPTSGSSLFVFADSGSTLTIVSLSDVEDLAGPYTHHQNPGATAEITIGDLTYNFVFTNSNGGIYVVAGTDATNGYQTGVFTSLAGTAPASIAQKIFKFQPISATYLTALLPFQIVVGTNNSYYKETAAGRSASSTLSYNQLNRATGQIYFNDALMPNGIMRLCFSSTNEGFYVYKLGAGNQYEIGSFKTDDVSAPVVKAQPQAQSILLGKPAQFSVLASGTAPLAYQWFKNGFPIPGATSSTYTIAAVASSDAGKYRVEISNTFGSVKSVGALLTVLCGTAIVPSGAFFDYTGAALAGNSNSISVSTPIDCTWTVTNSSWIQITSATNGTRTGIVTFTVSTNNSPQARNGIIKIGSQSFTVAQGGEFAPAHLIAKTIKNTIASGSGLFATNGEYLLSVSSGTSNTITSVGLTTNVGSGSGPYLYTRTTATTAELTTPGSSNNVLILSFDSPKTGTFVSSNRADSTGQDGTFVLNASGPDFNSDGRDDLTWAKTNGPILLWMMRGTNILSGLNGAIEFTKTFSTVRLPVGMADFNRDGHADLLIQHATGHITVFPLTNTLTNSGTNLVIRISSLGEFFLNNGRPLSSGWKAVGAADFNNNGSPDILMQHSDGRMAIWLMNGTNLASVKILRNGLPVGTGWNVAVLSDFNGDLQTDIAFQHTTGKVAIWYMNRTEFVRSGRLSSDLTMKLKAVADLNSDGQNDLIWQQLNGKLRITYMDGTATIGSVLFANGLYPSGYQLVGPR